MYDCVSVVINIIYYYFVVAALIIMLCHYHYMFFHYYYYSFAVYDRVVVGYYLLFIMYCVVIGLISARLLGAGTATGKVCGARFIFEQH